MCKVPDQAEQTSPDAQTFAGPAEFLAAITPGMDLCTSDFTGWAMVDQVQADAHVVRGKRHSDGRAVEVPASALIDIRGGHCVRVDRVRATIDSQGWEVA